MLGWTHHADHRDDARHREEPSGKRSDVTVGKSSAAMHRYVPLCFLVREHRVKAKPVTELCETCVSRTMVRPPLILRLRPSRNIGVSCFKCFSGGALLCLQRLGLYGYRRDFDAVGASNEE